MRSAAVCAMAIVAGSLAACSDALVFGDRTSIEVASVRLNDDVAEPIRVNIGFDRQLVTNAPALGGTVERTDADGRTKTAASGEAINLFSSFFAEVGPEMIGGEERNLLKVHTRFASGAAAVEIAGEPPVVARVLGLQEVAAPTVELADLQTALNACLVATGTADDGPNRIDRMATDLGLETGLGADDEIAGRILRIADHSAYEAMARVMQPFCPEVRLP